MGGEGEKIKLGNVVVKPQKLVGLESEVIFDDIPLNN